MSGQQPAPTCKNCAVWNTPQAPFLIYGNTYYVGPHGLSSILLTSKAGHVLIDGALPESASQIAANIRTLGFRIEDVKLILSSHVHFDHAGGIAELQRLSGAQVAASPWSATVMKSGVVAADDPQFGVLLPLAPVARVRTVKDGEVLTVGPLSLTAHMTPGHTPGGTSWTWQACEGGRCVDLVYMDSTTPVSAEGFKYTKNAKYKTGIQDFEKSIAFLNTVKCDILLTAHPEAAGLWQRLEARERKTSADPMVDTGACRVLAGRAKELLQKRIADEAAQP
ncbi:MAG: subclass B3 metallo-beta-lactamase [Acidobacteriota bacterium]